MNSDTEIETCPACGEDTDTLTKRTWTHYDHDSGWAYEDGERVTGEYCPDCLADIDRIVRTQEELGEDEEMTAEDWKELACRLATGINRAFSNWQDVASVTKRELRALNEYMGEGWQRGW